MRRVNLWGLLLLALTANVEARRRLPNEAGLNATDFGRHLLGKAVDVPTPTSPDDHLVTDLPLLDPSKFTTKHWAGLLPASGNGDKYLFYWLFAPAESEKPDSEIPLVIWLNGGPACSSMDGLWIENGPFRLVNNDGEWTIDIAPYSWHNAPAYTVYIDQPVGTGISFTTSGKYPTNDEEVNIDFYYFLKEFFKLHADKFLDESKNTLSRKLFFSGESHAGHYIPSMMNYIRKQNLASPEFQIPLAGAAIGNGWMDPYHQYAAHEVAYGYSLIGRSQMRSLIEDQEKCQKALSQGKYLYTPCFDLMDTIVANSLGAGSGSHVSGYDYQFIEVKAQPREFPPGHKAVEAYLGGGSSITTNREDVLAAIHSLPSLEAGQVYQECTNPPYNALKHQDGLGVTLDVKELLDSDVNMLFFNGVNDLICNHVGNEIALENIEWTHQSEFQLATRYGWKSAAAGKIGGYMKEFENLMFLKILDSGHMVPMDVPDISLEMMQNLLFDESFQTYKQNLGLAELTDECGECPSVSSECPVCQTCPPGESSSTLSPASGDDDDSDGSQVSAVQQPGSPASFALGMIVTAAVLGIAYCFFSKARSPTGGQAKVQRDLELQSTSSSYTDRPQMS
eukprot:Nitzschia sp. Nitz4//scaffold36_size144017//87077//88939//NITZ4_003100-RA/size144017-processed-gene-0.82-mRNA-1//-1//CDS//3329549498//5873//frame0